MFWKGGRPQTTIWRMRTACWIPKATHTHTHTHTHTQVVLYSLLFHCNHGSAKALQCLPVLLPCLGSKYTNHSMYEIVTLKQHYCNSLSVVFNLNSELEHVFIGFTAFLATPKHPSPKPRNELWLAES